MPRTAVFALALCLVPVTELVAAEPSHGASRARAIAPYVKESTLGIVRVDLTRFDANDWAEGVKRLPLPFGPRAEELLSQTLAALPMIKEAGFREVFAIVHWSDLPTSMPLLVLPMNESAKVDALRGKLPWLKHWDADASIESTEKAILVGGSRARRPSLAEERRSEPVLDNAFEAAGDGLLQFLLLPSKTDRRVVEEVMPTLPQGIGGGPSSVLTQGLVWAAIGLDVGDTPALRVVVQSRDRDAANRMRGLWVASLALLMKNEMVAEEVRDPATALRLLTPRVADDRLILSLDESNDGMTQLLSIVEPSVEQINERVATVDAIKSLKQLGIAMHNYHDVHKHFPPAAATSKEGKPLLSWRVLLLPYLGQKKLYEQFRLDEPWDSEHNRKLVEKIPAVYAVPQSKGGEVGLTRVVVPVEKGTIFPHGALEGTKISKITDGTSNTIMVVVADAEHGVIWTKPEDLIINPDDPFRGLLGTKGTDFLTLFADGSVRVMNKSIGSEKLRAFFTRGGGEVIER
ncbi:hypothetical protein Pan216_14370 [Planctomycetes bacterium Pan216]|uniref:DUF1559 domain-containing protein n=1 Tax=Kolteria novifilia TaxID=2527975 RepID=A0A518B0V4_9BACT|nr:hypothetical protein Pan216_14370 [Planctomycetes bacterium Pan216]